MTELPEGWESVATVDCFDQVSTNDKKVKTKECLERGLYPVIDQGQNNIAGYLNDLDKVIHVEEPLIIFGDHTRAIKWVPHDFIPGADGTKVLKPKAFVDNRFSYFQLKSLDIPDRGYSRHFQFLKVLPFSIPPLNEQIRIANKLDSLLAKVDAAQARLEKIPTLLKRFRQSILAAATSGELTKEWRDKNQTESISVLVEKSFIKKGKLKVRSKNGWDANLLFQDLPNNWAWIPNFKLAQDKSTAICAGPFGTIFKAKDFRDKGVPIIFLRHVKESGFNQKKPNYMDQDVWEEYHQEYSVYGGELLVTKLGDPPGEACIFPSDFGTAMVTPDVLKMNVDTALVSTEYLKYFFNSPNCKNMVRDLAFGATRLRIDIPMFKNFPIPLAPINEQKEIVRRVESLFALADSVEKQYTEAKKYTDHLTQSLLAKAFRGELVPQDPNDEPASELLKRIQAEREQLALNKPKRKIKTTTNNKTKKKVIMKLNDAPESYLAELLTQLGGEADAKILWDKTDLAIDDFYAKLKQEMQTGVIVDDKASSDPAQRKLKIAESDSV